MMLLGRRRAAGVPAGSLPVSWTATIGEGPVATVYSGHCDGEPVALKVFPDPLDRRTLAAAEREHEKLAALARTKPILPVDDIEQLADGRHALRMELCAESLDSLVQRAGALGPADVLVLGHAVATALAAAHGAGVVHGGVRPSNVLFRRSGLPVLADFGVGLRKAFPRDIERVLEGLAPETLRTDLFDERTDLYGLGALLHVALTGRPPLPSRLGERLGDRMLRLLRTRVPEIDRPGVSPELSALVAELLLPDPSRRPAGAAEVADRLSGLMPRRSRSAPVVALPAVTAWPEDDSEAGLVPVAQLPEVASAETWDPDEVPAPGAPRPRRVPRVLLFGAACAAVGALVVVVLPSESPPSTGTPPPAPVVSAASASAGERLELAPPTDLGDQVALTWTSTRPMTYAVVVAPEGEPNHTVLANQDTSMRLPVDPVRKYCFQIRATDGGDRVYVSLPGALRGALCHS